MDSTKAVTRTREYQLGRIDGRAEAITEVAYYKKRTTELEARLDKAQSLLNVALGIGRPRWWEQAAVEIREWLASKGRAICRQQ